MMQPPASVGRTSHAMTNVQTILCPRCHKPGRRQARFCQHCRHDMVLNNPGPRYYITRIVKAGGQGAVYEAVGEDNKIYAVKEMLDSFTDQQERDEAIERFDAEAKLLQQLSHPRIPRVYTSFKDEGKHYLAMDFVRGEDLEEIVEREGAIPERRVLEWADQICDVLGYLHKNTFIYRDMKPSNVMVDTSGSIKLVDFGIAKVLQSGKRGTQIGTPGYAPPEQYQGIATVESDIYALGATLHHLLTGRDPQTHPPFTFPPVRDLMPSVSKRTSDALSQALEMKAENRFHSLDEFRDALGIGKPTRPAQARPAPPPAQPRPAPPPAPARVPATTAIPAPSKPASKPRTQAAPPNTAPAPPVPQPQSKPRGRGCTWFITGTVLALVLLGYMVSQGGITGFFAATPTPQTLILQPFQTQAEIIVPAGTDEAGLKQAFEYTFLELARRQYGPSIQLQPNTVVYANNSVPERLGEEARGVRYRASLEGSILVPKT